MRYTNILLDEDARRKLDKVKHELMDRKLNSADSVSVMTTYSDAVRELYDERKALESLVKTCKNVVNKYE